MKKENSAGTKMVEQVNYNMDSSRNKRVDKKSGSEPPTPERGTKIGDNALSLAHNSNKNMAPMTPEKVTVPQTVTGCSQSGWTSVPNSPLQKRPSFCRISNKTDGESELMDSPTMHDSYFSYGKNLERSQSNTSERSYSYLPDRSASIPKSSYGTPEQIYSHSYPFTSVSLFSGCDSPSPSSASSVSSSMSFMDRYYPPYSVVSSSGYPVSSAGYPISTSVYSPVCQNYYSPYWQCYSCRKPKLGSSTVAIDNKIEQAMDLVKSHLMYAVREEVEVLKEQIKELIEKNSQLEHENNILKAAASPETLALLAQPRQSQPPPPSS